MDDLQFIVQRLNAAPFSMSIRAFELEKFSPDELLQLLIDIASSLDAEMKADVALEAKEAVIEKLIHFLATHKCKLLPLDGSGLTEWTDSIVDGNNSSSILHWMLSNYEHLQKRTYLANFLMPIDVPQEYLHQSDSNLWEMATAYQELQAEFVAVHKEFERVSASSGRSASDLAQGIKQLLIERQQLLDKLEREKSQTKGNAKFEQLLEETSKLRQAEDDEMRLQEQKQEQHQLMTAAKQRLSQVRQLHDVLVSNDSDSLEQLEKGRNKSIRQYELAFRQRIELEAKLLQTKQKLEASKDSKEIEGIAMELEETLQQKLDELDDLRVENFSLDSLKTFQQHVYAATSKFFAKKEELKAKERERELAKKAVDELRESAQKNDKEGHRNELEQFRANFRSQAKAYVEAKHNLEAMQNMNADLQDKEHRLIDLVASLKLQEEESGVAGFRDVNDRLEQTSKDTAALNELKSQTLEDISITIQKIALALEGKRKELEPKVNAIKKARVQFEEFKKKYNSEKTRYDELVNKLKSDNESLEAESNSAKQQFMEKEKQYQQICASNEALPNSSNIEGISVLETRVIEQDTYIDELQNQLCSIKEKEAYSEAQKSMFMDLIKLLEIKMTPLDSSLDDEDHTVSNEIKISNW